MKKVVKIQTLTSTFQEKIVFSMPIWHSSIELCLVLGPGPSHILVKLKPTNLKANAYINIKINYFKYLYDCVFCVTGAMFERSGSQQELAFNRSISMINTDNSILYDVKLTQIVEHVAPQDSFRALKHCKYFL